MAIKQLNIKQIISQAVFLSERLDNQQFKAGFSPVNEQEASQRLDHWCSIVAQKDREKFQNRLEWSGWNIEQVRQVLGTIPELDEQSLPTWAITLTEIIQSLPKIISEDIYPSPIEPGESLPFEDVLLPLIGVARHKLLVRLGSHSLSPEELPLKLLVESAYLKIERALLRRLLNIASKTLDFEFSSFRSVGENLLNLVLQKTKGTSSKVKYNTFVQKLLSDGLLGFFKKYPVLARLIATAIDFWVEATGEFIERLNADLSEIQQLFCSEKVSLGKVIEIGTDLSDPHNQGRSVIALTFESNLRLIYKPKNLNLEVVFNQFLDWCNQQLLQDKSQEIRNSYIPFKVLNILSRNTYGWVEYVEQKSCEDETAAQRFYLRAGMLLCLLYVLGGTDCHYENLIASGEYPVLIDMETVMHHEAKPIEEVFDKPASLVATNQLMDSVLRTGLLPIWEFGAEQSVAHDFSGLGSVETQPTQGQMPVWKFINTDDMYQGYEIVTIPPQANVPTLNGAIVSPNYYLRELVTGFEQMYHFFIRQRDTLLKSDSPLTSFRSEQVRFIFRPTRIYGRVLQKSIEPKSLRNGIDWSIELDVLSRSFLTTRNKPQNWSILSAELRTLGQFDFPYFTATTGSDALILEPGKLIANYFQAPSYNQVLARLEELSEADLSQQVRIIQLVFHSRVARTMEIYSGDRSLVEPGEYSGTPVTNEQLLRQAEDIATEIQQQAISGTDGSLTWIGLTYVTTAERFQIQPLGATLYDGICGIALFLAAFDRVKGKSQFSDLALRAISPIREVWSRPDKEYVQEFAQGLGIGGATGLGSIIYSLVKLGEFLEIPQLCEDALLATRFMTSEMIASDHKYDIIGGAAGAILALLALYRQTGEPEVLQRAIACGQHLLKSCDSAYSPQAGNPPVPKPLTGFSHGAAGIAYSLLQLHGVTQDSSYLEAARQGIAYESSFFSPSTGNWPIISPVSDPSASPVFWSTWCYGSPGIALGRLAGASIYQTQEVLTDIQVALNTTQKTALQDIDHLCCGNLGRAEVLLVAGQKLSNPLWHQAAQELAARVVQRATQTGHYRLFSELPTPVFSPCFFQGMAGIGYQLLRLAYPQSLPSVLLWE